MPSEHVRARALDISLNLVSSDPFRSHALGFPHGRQSCSEQADAVSWNMRKCALPRRYGTKSVVCIKHFFGVLVIVHKASSRSAADVLRSAVAAASSSPLLLLLCAGMAAEKWLLLLL